MIRFGIHPSAVIDFAGQLTLPESTIIEPLVVIYVGISAKLVLGEKNILYPGCVIRIDKGEMTTGEDVSFGPGCQIYEPRGSLTIGSHCMIGGGTLISGVNHGYAQFDIPMRDQPASSLPVVIENDVWIGMGVKLLPGVRIGTGSIIGAGSVVANDIPPYSIAMGIPCKITRQREQT
ncbi:MAG: acyltransferase [Proteobacteria bacterium]|nr:acyltransferase [Pseudomonadota bacterium]